MTLDELEETREQVKTKRQNAAVRAGRLLLKVPSKLDELSIKVTKSGIMNATAAELVTAHLDEFADVLDEKQYATLRNAINEFNFGKQTQSELTRQINEMRKADKTASKSETGKASSPKKEEAEQDTAKPIPSTKTHADKASHNSSDMNDKHEAKDASSYITPKKPQGKKAHPDSRQDNSPKNTELGHDEKPASPMSKEDDKQEKKKPRKRTQRKSPKKETLSDTDKKPDEISAKTLKDMDVAISNMEDGKVSTADLSDFKKGDNPGIPTSDDKKPDTPHEVPKPKDVDGNQDKSSIESIEDTHKVNKTTEKRQEKPVEKRTGTQDGDKSSPDVTHRERTTPMPDISDEDKTPEDDSEYDNPDITKLFNDEDELEENADRLYDKFSRRGNDKTSKYTKDEEKPLKTAENASQGYPDSVQSDDADEKHDDAKEDASDVRHTDTEEDVPDVKHDDTPGTEHDDVKEDVPSESSVHEPTHDTTKSADDDDEFELDEKPGSEDDFTFDEDDEADEYDEPEPPVDVKPVTSGQWTRRKSHRIRIGEQSPKYADGLGEPVDTSKMRNVTEAVLSGEHDGTTDNGIYTSEQDDRDVRLKSPQVVYVENGNVKTAYADEKPELKQTPFKKFINAIKSFWKKDEQTDFQ